MILLENVQINVLKTIRFISPHRLIFCYFILFQDIDMKAVHSTIMLLTLLTTSLASRKNASSLEDNFDIGDVDYIDPIVDVASSNFIFIKDENITDHLNVSDDRHNCTNDYCVSNDEYIDMIERHIFPSPSEWVLIALHGLVFCIGLVGNALVCVAVYRNRTMRTVTNYFIVNLAVADFMVILFCLPPTVVWDVTQTWFLGTLCCKIVLYFQVRSCNITPFFNFYALGFSWMELVTVNIKSRYLSLDRTDIKILII